MGHRGLARSSNHPAHLRPVLDGRKVLLVFHVVYQAQRCTHGLQLQDLLGLVEPLPPGMDSFGIQHVVRSQELEEGLVAAAVLPEKHWRVCL